MLTMDPWTLSGIALVLFLAAAAQSAVGFGYALFATPLLVLMGLPLQNVVALVSTCSMTQAMLGAHHLRAQVPWRIAFAATGIRLAGLALGLAGLKILVSRDQGIIRLAVGLALCAVVLLQWCWRPKPAERLHPAWAALAFSASGVLAGLLGMGGPPLILWVMAHHWSPFRARAFLFAVFAMAIPVQLAMMTATFGSGAALSIGLGLAGIPLVYAGTRLGMPVGNRLSRETLRRLAYGLLLFIGLSTIWRTLSP